MPPKTHDELRQAFLAYFEARGHRVVPSYSLIPPDDPTLLFVNAGMVQFKDVFTGMKKVPYKRATSSQKCLRVSGKHNDLDNVGRTARHHTFFEMLGNFSFGDYFKEEAIRFGWGFLTEVCALPAEKLWVSVHPDDDEAYALWRDSIGVPEARLVRDPDNFWSMGETGACGPCSEIYVDQGPAEPGWEDAVFGDDSDRYLEVWNLVFMQFDRSADGTLTPLPSPSIDTGMGLERILAVMQGQTSNYHTDLFRPLLAVVEAATGRTYGGDEGFDTACRVLADHARAAAFLIADGIYPEHEGRGYVLRRVLRRAIRFGRRVGMEPASVSLVADKVVEVMGEAWPALREARPVIAQVLQLEEERFGRTLAEGERLLDEAMASLRDGGGETLAGELAFTLHDTHGFPLDLTELIAREHGLGVDRAGFEAALEAQRDRSRQGQAFAASAKDDVLDGLAAEWRTEFVGYDAETADATAVALLRDGALVERLAPGDTGTVVLDRTPFYAESGGQVGDVGTIRVGGAVFTVEDTRRYGDALVLHQGRLAEDGEPLAAGARVDAVVDHAARTATRANHSATHLLHLALREVLGSHVRQRGSLVAPDRLRFDFSHFAPMTSAEIEAVERRVNALIRENVDARTEVLPFDQAVAGGAIAFFDEKYGDRVRVLAMGPSVELCGGTHVARTGDIGLMAILSESSVQSGVRRLEARTGAGALTWLHGLRASAGEAAQRLNAPVEELPDKIDALIARRKELEKALTKARTERVSGRKAPETLAARGDMQLIGLHVEDADRKMLLPLLDELRGELGAGAVLLTGEVKGRLAVLLGVTENATERLHAGNLVKGALQACGGRGGGNARTGQGGLDGADGATIDVLRAAARAQFEAQGASG